MAPYGSLTWYRSPRSSQLRASASRSRVVPRKRARLASGGSLARMAGQWRGVVLGSKPAAGSSRR
jgi:hypothetical protein